MATYATEEDLAAYVQDSEEVIAPEGDAAERLLLRGENDVDRLLAPIERDETTGRKLDPDALTAGQQAALSRAVCAACEWRLMIGEDELIGDEGGIQSAAGITFKPVERPPAPKTLEELSGYGLPIRSGTVAPSPDADTA
jgi:hypothetical protein